MANTAKHIKPLPDIVSCNLKVLLVGFNPGIYSAQTGHHYAGKSNRFWKLLYEAGITPYRFRPEEDRKLLDLGYGSTNIVDRVTKSSGEITRQEFIEGSDSLYRLISDIHPQIVCYVGFGVFRIFASARLNIAASRLQVTPGIQKNNIFPGTIDFVCSNPSGLNTIPYGQQLECFKALKELADTLPSGVSRQV